MAAGEDIDIKKQWRDGADLSTAALGQKKVYSLENDAAYCVTTAKRATRVRSSVYAIRYLQ